MQNILQQELHNDMPADKSHSFTPSELIHRHIANPDEPITDEVINNLNLDTSTQLPQNKKEEADEEADLLSKDNTGTAYYVHI